MVLSSPDFMGKYDDTYDIFVGKHLGTERQDEFWYVASGPNQEIADTGGLTPQHISQYIVKMHLSQYHAPRKPGFMKPLQLRLTSSGFPSVEFRLPETTNIPFFTRPLTPEEMEMMGNEVLKALKGKL